MGLIDKFFCIELMLEKSGFPQKMSESSISINLITLIESCVPHQLKFCLAKQHVFLVLRHHAIMGQDTYGSPN